MLLLILMVKKLNKNCNNEKELQKTNQKEFRIEKLIKNEKQAIYQIERL